MLIFVATPSSIGVVFPLFGFLLDRKSHSHVVKVTGSIFQLSLTLDVFFQVLSDAPGYSRRAKSVHFRFIA